MLIFIGVMFLLGTMGVLDSHGIVVLFGRYWPALLILWGIIKLMEHEQAKRSGLPGRGIGVGGVFLMIFLVVARPDRYRRLAVNWGNMRDHSRSTIRISTNLRGSNLRLQRGSQADARRNDRASHLRRSRHDNDQCVRRQENQSVMAQESSRGEARAKPTNQSKTKVTITPADKVVTLNANMQAAGDRALVRIWMFTCRVISM